MIDDYKGLAVFVTIADTGSLSGAGRQLRLSTSVVSHHLGRLENRLGATLFYRSTRSLSLTPEGQRILPAARRMAAAGEEALDALTQISDQPVGRLRVTMPAFGVGSFLHRAVWSFARAHPMVSITLFSSDETLDLIKEGYDVAIRLGRLRDSSLKSRKVGEFHRVLVASPDYLASVDPPITGIEDLPRCNFVSLAMLPDRFSMLRHGEVVEIQHEQAQVQVNAVTAAKSALLAGLGVQHMPVSEVESELQSGALVQVVPDWSLPMMSIYAVWPETGPQKHLTRRFVDALAAADP